jgi:hypothetical protein
MHDWIRVLTSFRKVLSPSLNPTHVITELLDESIMKKFVTKQPHVQWVAWAFPREQSGRVLKLIAHFHVVLRLRIHGGIPPLPHRFAWCGA